MSFAVFVGIYFFSTVLFFLFFLPLFTFFYQSRSRIFYLKQKKLLLINSTIVNLIYVQCVGTFAEAKTAFRLAILRYEIEVKKTKLFNHDQGKNEKLEENFEESIDEVEKKIKFSQIDDFDQILDKHDSVNKYNSAMSILSKFPFILQKVILFIYSNEIETDKNKIII